MVVPRDELAVADHEHGVAVDAELVEHLADRASPREVDLAVWVAQRDPHGTQANARVQRRVPLRDLDGQGSSGELDLDGPSAAVGLDQFDRNPVAGRESVEHDAEVFG